MFNLSLINKNDLKVLFAVFLVLSLQAVVISISPLNLAGDEAYYWLWSKHLDICYYEKGPGIAFLIYLGCKIFGDTVLGVRFGALLCQFLISAILYLFVSQNYSRKSAKLSLLAYWSTLLFGTLGLFMTCDPPLCLFWLISLIFAHKAIEKDNPKLWIPSFFSIGLAALFKYTALMLFPTFVLFLLLTPKYRRHLFQPAFLVAIIILVIVISPVVIWNANHDWINFGKAYGHMGNQSRKLGFARFFELIFGQWGLIGLILLPLFLTILRLSIKFWREGDALQGLMVFTIFPLSFICLILSFQRSIYANWPMPIYFGLILLLARNFEKCGERFFGLFKKSLVLNFIVLILVHFIFTGKTYGLSPKILPSGKLISGKGLGLAVNQHLNSNVFDKCGHLTSNRGPQFVLSERYMDASLIAFYSGKPDLVYLADPNDMRLNQFDIWQEWSNLKEKNALLVVADKNELKEFKHLFSEISEIGELERRYDGHLVGKTYFYAACNFNGKNLSAINFYREQKNSHSLGSR